MTSLEPGRPAGWVCDFPLYTARAGATSVKGFFSPTKNETARCLPSWFSAAFFTLIPVQLRYYNHYAQSLNSTIQAWLSGWLHCLTSGPLFCVVLFKASALQVVVVFLLLTAVSVALCPSVLLIQALLVLLSYVSIVSCSCKSVEKAYLHAGMSTDKGRSYSSHQKLHVTCPGSGCLMQLQILFL